MKTLACPDNIAVLVFVLNLLLQSTAVCLVTLFLVRRVFRHIPSLRYSACLTGLVCIMFSPFIVWFQSKSGYGLLVVPLLHGLTGFESAPLLLTTTGLDHAANSMGATTQSSTSWWLAGGVFIWAAGVAWEAIRFLHGCLLVRRLTHDMRPYDLPVLAETRTSMERLLGRSLPPTFTSPRIAFPIAIGLFRPAVILPEGLAQELSPTQLRQVLLHEGGHIAFHHPISGVIERMARLLFWPHPLIHLLCSDLDQAREEVCDNVASQEDGVACYARTLLAIAQGRDTTPAIPSTLALQGPENSLGKRIEGLLDPRRNRMIHSTRRHKFVVGTTIAAILAMSAVLRVSAAPGTVKHTDDSYIEFTVDGKTTRVPFTYIPSGMPEHARSEAETTGPKIIKISADSSYIEFTVDGRTTRSPVVYQPSGTPEHPQDR